MATDISARARAGALVDNSRREILAGAANPTLARRVRRQGQQPMEMLAPGLADYRTRHSG
jgi:hypothetical protein